jgi:hypothetical protein
VDQQLYKSLENGKFNTRNVENRALIDNMYRVSSSRKTKVEASFADDEVLYSLERTRNG